MPIIKFTPAPITDDHSMVCPIPRYAHVGDAGMDIHAYLKEPLMLSPGYAHAVPTGLRVALPEVLDGDYVWQLEIRPKSGLALKQNLTVLNSPGTIDNGFRSEIKVILFNAGDDAVLIQPNQKIAQMVLTKAYRIDWEITEDLGDTERGEGGFGSSGVF